MMKALARTTVGIDSGGNQTNLAPALLEIAKLARCTDSTIIRKSDDSLVFANIGDSPFLLMSFNKGSLY